MALWLWYATAAALALAAALLLYYALIHDRPRGRRRCPKCWYDMTGLDSLTCPECGKTHRRERKLHKTRRRRLPLALALVLLLVAAVAAAHPTMRAKEYGWWTHAPTWLLIEAALRNGDQQRWKHLSVRLRAASDEDGTAYPRQLTFGWSWRRLARGCADTVLDPSGGINRPRAGLLLSLNPEKEAVQQALSRLIKGCNDENARRVAMTLRAATSFGATFDSSATWRLLDLAVDVEDPVLARQFIQALMNGTVDYDTVEETLRRLPDGEEGRHLAEAVVDALVMTEHPPTLESRLSFADRLAAATDLTITRWRDLTISLREDLRAHAALREVQGRGKDSANLVMMFNAGALLGMSAAEQADALRRDLLGHETTEDKKRRRGIDTMAGLTGAVAMDARQRGDLNVDLLDPQAAARAWLLETPDLLHAIGRIRAEEAIRRGDIIDLTATDADNALARLLKTTDCRAREEVARLVEHYLYLNDGLGEAWIPDLLAAACNHTCPVSAALFAELLARDSTVRAAEIRFLITARPANYAGDRLLWESIINGLKLSRAPVEDRLALVDSLLAGPDILAGRHSNDVEFLRRYLAEQAAEANPSRAREEADVATPAPAPSPD